MKIKQRRIILNVGFVIAFVLLSAFTGRTLAYWYNDITAPNAQTTEAYIVIGRWGGS